LRKKNALGVSKIGGICLASDRDDSHDIWMLYPQSRSSRLANTEWNRPALALVLSGQPKFRIHLFLRKSAGNNFQFFIRAPVY
jgi:hypothetical protein